MIDPHHETLSISRQCKLMELPRSSYYRETRTGETEDSLMYMRLIDEIYLEHPAFGARKIRDILQRRGYGIGRIRVRRLMQVMGIESMAPKPNTSKPSKAHKIYPYLLRKLNITKPNQVWAADITYLPLKGSHVYLVAILDLFSRMVLSWEVSVTMDDSFCVSALERAIRLHGTPEIFNTDQGAQFTGCAFTGVLKENGIRISMDGKGRAADNIFVERLWRTLKYEEIYIKSYETMTTLKQNLTTYFGFYNQERPHDALDKRTPFEAYNGLTAKGIAA